jgi:hypothetical protein
LNSLKQFLLKQQYFYQHLKPPCQLFLKYLLLLLLLLLLSLLVPLLSL